MGLVFTPLQVVAFATLPTELRTNGTALFSLVRSCLRRIRRLFTPRSQRM